MHFKDPQTQQEVPPPAVVLSHEHFGGGLHQKVNWRSDPDSAATDRAIQKDKAEPDPNQLI